MYRIIRRFEFAYAHRLWPGENGELVASESRCTRLHGHNALVELELSAKDVNASGVVCDFTVLEHQIGNWLREHWDHRTFLHESDPLVRVLRETADVAMCVRTFAANPTCEIFAKSLYTIAQQLGLPVSAVCFHETPRNQAVYRPDPEMDTPAR